jgi:tetratricopeptide (TPR) repeat protein
VIETKQLALTMKELSTLAIFMALAMASCAFGNSAPDWLNHARAAQEALLKNNRDKAIEEAHYLEGLNDKQPPGSSFTDGVLPSDHFGCQLYILADRFHQKHLENIAEALYRKAIKAEEADYGNDSLETARNSWQHLSRFLWDVHRSDEAKAIDDRISNQFKDDVKILLYSAEVSERQGDSEKAESQLKKAVNIAESKGSSRQEMSLKKESLRNLVGFYHQHFMFDKERQVISPLRQLEQSEPTRWYWQYLSNLDLAQNKFKDALSDCQNIQDKRSAKEFSKTVSAMVAANKFSGTIGKPLTNDELKKLAKSEAILVCHIDGWEISTMALNHTAVAAYVTPVKALTSTVPMQRSIIFIEPMNWEDQQSQAATLLHLQSKNQNALVFASKPTDCLTSAPKTPPLKMIPTYFSNNLVVLPADDNTLSTLRKLRGN